LIVADLALLKEGLNIHVFSALLFGIIETDREDGINLLLSSFFLRGANLSKFGIENLNSNSDSSEIDRLTIRGSV